VTLGGAAAPGLAVAADKASLTFAVPNGTNGGPVVLTTAGGPVAVPGGDFTVTPSTPVIATLTPASGVPGTEVALDGSGLASATQVAYAGLVLNSSRFDIDGDTRIRVRIPDDAQAGGVLTVTTAAGSATAPAFTLLPSRRGVLPQPLEKIDGTFGEGPWVNFPGGRRSAMYGLLEPMAPVFHAYNPDGLDNATPPVDCNRPGHTHTRFTVNLKLPQAFYAFLPASVRDRIAAQGIDPANVDIFCVSQDYQYDGTTPEGGVYLFRPHYWTDPDVPVSGSIATLNHNLSAAIFETDPLLPVTISGNVPGVFFDFAISTHEAGGPPPGPIVASGNSEPMAGFDVTGSNGLWSLTQEGPRAAATLHLLFNDADQATLGNLALTSGTVQELVQGMATSLGTTRGVQLLQSLFRPEVASLGQAPAGANKTVTLAGTGLRDATAVLLDGTPSGTVTVVSDTIVKVALPAGVTGNLQVVTPMGASDPVGLPAI
jgi:hypothetical protein